MSHNPTDPVPEQPPLIWRPNDPIPTEIILDQFRKNIETPEQLKAYLGAVDALKRANRSLFDDPTFLKNAAATIIAGIVIVSFSLGLFWPLAKDRLELADIRGQVQDNQHELTRQNLTKEKEQLITDNKNLAGENEKLAKDKELLGARNEKLNKNVEEISAALATQVGQSKQFQQGYNEQLEKNVGTEADKEQIRRQLELQQEYAKELEDTIKRVQAVGGAVSPNLQSQLTGTFWGLTNNTNAVAQITKEFFAQDEPNRPLPAGTPYSARLYLASGGLLVYQTFWRTDGFSIFTSEGTWSTDDSGMVLKFSPRFSLRVESKDILFKGKEAEQFRSDGFMFQRKREDF